MALIVSFFTSSRSATFLAICILAISQITILNQKKNDSTLPSIEKQKIRKAIIAIVCLSVIGVLVLFLYVSTKKNPSAYGDVSRLDFFLKSIANYTNVSSATFVKWYQQGVEHNGGQTTFRLIFAILNKIGLEMPVKANSGGVFLEIDGISSNAFTVARDYIEDFGVVYMSMVLLIFGAIHGAVYKKTKTKNQSQLYRYSLLNGMLFVPLMYQVLTNQYLNVLSQWIQFSLWIVLCTSKLFWRDAGSNMNEGV